MKIKTYKEEITSILTNKPRTRDNSALLYWYLLKELDFEPKTLTAEEVLTFMNSKVLPHWESVSRCSRLIQKENPNLRGEKRKQRLAHQEDVKQELGYKI